MPGLIITSIADRPDLEPMLWQVRDVWPPFMRQDPVSAFYYDVVDTFYPEHALVAFEPDRPGVTVACAFAVPFAFGPGTDRESLPDSGWDAAITFGWHDHVIGRTPTHVSALEIAISRERQGEGLAGVMLAALRDNSARLGFSDLFAPVRPTGKPREPRTPMSEYAARRRPDGLPEDPWLRVHVRAGGEIVRVCPRAMTIAGSLAEWRAWTGLPFDRSGDVEVPGGLVPVHCSVEHDHAAYIEPGVWIHHRLSPAAT